MTVSQVCISLFLLGWVVTLGCVAFTLLLSLRLRSALPVAVTHRRAFQWAPLFSICHLLLHCSTPCLRWRSCHWPRGHLPAIKSRVYPFAVTRVRHVCGRNELAAHSILPLSISSFTIVDLCTLTPLLM